MTYLLILLFCFVGLIILVMFFFLKRVVININKQSKDYFIDKLQVYDELINEKEEKLKGLNKKIDKKIEFKRDSKETEKNESVYLYDMKNIDYQDDEIFKKMKEVESRFNVDNVKIIEKFIKDYFVEEDVSYYLKLTDIKNEMNQEFIYQLVLKKADVQEKKIKELLGDMGSILDDFKKKNKKFDVLKFISYFDKIIDKSDPFIYVYTGNKSLNYDSINSFIRTRVDEKIYKGITIIYKGKLYDYSLK